MAKEGFWFKLSKVVFRNDINRIERELEHNPDLKKKKEEVKRETEKLKKMCDDFEDKWIK